MLVARVRRLVDVFIAYGSMELFLEGIQAHRTLEEGNGVGVFTHGVSRFSL